MITTYCLLLAVLFELGREGVGMFLLSRPSISPIIRTKEVKVYTTQPMRLHSLTHSRCHVIGKWYINLHIHRSIRSRSTCFIFYLFFSKASLIWSLNMHPWIKHSSSFSFVPPCQPFQITFLMSLMFVCPSLPSFIFSSVRHSRVFPIWPPPYDLCLFFLRPKAGPGDKCSKKQSRDNTFSDYN